MHCQRTLSEGHPSSLIQIVEDLDHLKAYGFQYSLIHCAALL